MPRSATLTWKSERTASRPKHAKTIATADCSFTKIVDLYLYSTTWYWLGKPIWTWQDIDLYNCQASPFHLFITVENLNIGVAGRHHHGHLHICSIVISVSTAFGGASSECQSQSGTVGATVLSGLVKLDVNGQVVVSITLFLLYLNSRRTQNSGSISQFHPIAHLAKKMYCSSGNSSGKCNAATVWNTWIFTHWPKHGH